MATQAGQIRGRCVICTSVFSSNSIAALHCGHTFHFVCISKWVEVRSLLPPCHVPFAQHLSLQRSKTCPICRVVTAERHIVKHLFFDSADDVAGSQAPGNSTAQVSFIFLCLARFSSTRGEYLSGSNSSTSLHFCWCLSKCTSDEWVTGVSL